MERIGEGRRRRLRDYDYDYDDEGEVRQTLSPISERTHLSRPKQESRKGDTRTTFQWFARRAPRRETISWLRIVFCAPEGAGDVLTQVKRQQAAKPETRPIVCPEWTRNRRRVKEFSLPKFILERCWCNISFRGRFHSPPAHI
ncbi:hypothetical protein OPV22_017307 [Ensete ventricosum]|uniref:Uncharacterized protein n=1 Tax=Ensete ventricosum TaxID=4639 RepID=A0AAV8QXP6_ENSVE|nr:hypothetical protein OPV22_017307 [Ensete ventricosum]